MSSNPNNAVGTNGAFGGRTSVNAFNDGIAAYSAGILSGWECSPSSGLTVVLGGTGNTRDVAIAEDNAGNKTTINNISGSPISVTVNNAPNNNSRIDSIVAYVNNPPTGSSTVTDNYGACGIIVVSGSPSLTPVAPNESTIRSAITADGASGTTAYYVVLANVTIPSGTTDLTSSNIASGDKAGIGENNIDFSSFSKDNTLSDGYYKMGDLLICWGVYNATIGGSAYAEVSHNFTFPQQYQSTPMVVSACGDIGGLAGEYSVVANASSTGCTIYVGRVASGDSKPVDIKYLAIGIAN